MQAETRHRPFLFPWRRLAACLLMLCALTLGSGAAHAVPEQLPDGTCTDQPEYFPLEEPASGTGLISSIIVEIGTPLLTVSSTMFQAIAGDAGFKNVLRLACSIYVAVYGILFTFGMVQVTIHDLMVRLIKIGIIYTLLTPAAWGYFYFTVVHFFNNGVDDIILRVSSIAFGTGTGAGALVGSPFDPMDQALIYIVSSKMVVTLLATFATGPYGFIIGIILLMSLGSFLKSIFNALWVYVMAFVIRTLMFGMAPIFIVCILFSRTRHLFDGWLNQVVNASLQPIFLFTFFAFFVLLIRSCIIHLFDTPVCWMPTGTNTGAPGVSHFWRFALKDCGVTNPDGSQAYFAFDGRWSFTGPEDIGPLAACNTQIHPIGVILPLMIWILADIASRFNHIVIEIAKDISNASTDLSMGGDSIKSWFNALTGGGGGGGTAPAKAGGAAAGERNTAQSFNKLVENVRKSMPGSDARGPGGDGTNPARDGGLAGRRLNPPANPPANPPPK